MTGAQIVKTSVTKQTATILVRLALVSLCYIDRCIRQEMRSVGVDKESYSVLLL